MAPTPRKTNLPLVAALITGSIIIAVFIVAITMSTPAKPPIIPTATPKATPSSLLPLAPRQTYPKQGSNAEGLPRGPATPAAQLPLFPDTHPSEPPFNRGIFNDFR